MALRGIKPTEIQKRLKMFVYGSAGVGKTMAAIQFPKPYIIDTEKGVENSAYVKIIQESGGAVFQSCDCDEAIKEVMSLLTEKHDYRTLVIDPLTTIYNDLLDKSALKVGTEFGRHYGDANKKMKNLINLLLRLDMNIIITSHAKHEYGKDLAVLGQTFDCYKKMDYLFDLVLELKKIGKDRHAIVKKSRIVEFPDDTSFPFSYEEVAKRYNKDVMEKESKEQVLASDSQIKELQRLVDLLKIAPEMVEKWLTKAESDSFAEMPSDIIQKCIDSLKNKLGGE